jgi:hypothetical protein
VGTIAALSFIVGTFFGAAGIVRLIDLRTAVIVTGMCVLVCLSMLVIFFA